MGHFVTNERVVVDMLRPTANGTAVEGHFGVLTTQIDIAEVASLTIEEGDAVVLDGAVASLMDINIAEA